MELAGFVFSENDEKKFDELISSLNIKKSDTGKELTIQQAIGQHSCTSIASFNDAVIIIDDFRPYDCGHQPDKKTRLDNILEDISNNRTVLCFYMMRTSSTYGFSVFKNGQRVRCFLSVEGELKSDSGDILSAEKEFQQPGQEEKRIFSITKEILQKGLNEIISENSLKMRSYC